MFWLIVGPAVFVAMGMLAVIIAMVVDGMRVKRAADEIWAQYADRVPPATAPRLQLVPFPEPEPPKLTDTGELRAMTDAWIAEHITGEGA